MNAFILVVPIILIRYGLLGMLSKTALIRAGFFAPVAGRERTAFGVYQVTQAFILLYTFFLRIRIEPGWFHAGLMVYCLGIALYAVSVVSYARPKAGGINLNGLYRVSRNPMYVAFFIIFLGIAALARSWVLLAVLIVFQLSTHWIIISEERWCLAEFGDEYKKYMNKVKRYL